jgi:molybdopterin converting factor subunit 1
MHVKVRFFAAIREQVGVAERDIEAPEGAGVDEVWAQATGKPLDDHVLVAVNQSYSARDVTITEGDEVAFFPPVTGG